LPSKTALRDLMLEPDLRNLDIQKVGVKGLHYPIIVQDRVNGTQHTVAEIQMSVHLPHNFRGTHMSRFIEILNRHRGNIASDNLKEILEETRERLDAEVAHMELEFPYFIEKKAPVTGAKALQFVEDVVRECALSLEQMEDVYWYRVEAENFESIHNHNAYALIENSKNGKED